MFILFSGLLTAKETLRELCLVSCDDHNSFSSLLAIQQRFLPAVGQVLTRIDIISSES